MGVLNRVLPECLEASEDPPEGPGLVDRKGWETNPRNPGGIGSVPGNSGGVARAHRKSGWGREGSGGPREVWNELEGPSENLGGVGRAHRSPVGVRRGQEGPRKSGRDRESPRNPGGVGRALQKSGKGRECTPEVREGSGGPPEVWKVSEGREGPQEVWEVLGVICRAPGNPKWGRKGTPKNPGGD